MSSSPTSVQTYLSIFFALMGLTLLTVVAAYVPLGPLGVPLALALALTKATLVILYFMHMRDSSHFMRFVVAAGFLWLIILFGITLTDYLFRDWSLKTPPKTSWITRSPAQIPLTQASGVNSYTS